MIIPFMALPMKLLLSFLVLLLFFLSSRSGKANPGELYTPLSDSNLSNPVGHLINLANLTGPLIPFRIVSLVTRSIVSKQNYPLLLKINFGGPR